MSENRPEHPHYPRGPQYDEQGALQRLEQLRRDIQTARWRREQAVAEFDKFISGFHEPPGPRPMPPPAPDVHAAPPPRAPQPDTMTRPAPGPEAHADAEPAARADSRSPAVPVAAIPPAFNAPPPAIPLAAPASPASPDLPPSTPQSIVPGEASLPAATAPEPPAATPAAALRMTRHQRKKTSSSVRSVLLVAAIVAVMALGLLLFRAGSGEPTSDPAPRVQANSGPASTAPRTPPPTAGSPAERVAAPAAARAVPSAAPAQPRALRLELVARAPVWIRVTVDGRRTIEREVSPGFRATIDADRAVAIRAGDAGALMVGENGGPPEPLGRVGQVMTRIFPSPSAR